MKGKIVNCLKTSWQFAAVIIGVTACYYVAGLAMRLIAVAWDGRGM